MLKKIPPFWVDTGLFMVLMATIVTVSADLFVHTFIHVALGISLCVVALLHLSLHWNWIKNTGQRYYRLPKPARSNAWLNIGLFSAYILCGSVGLSARAMLFSFHLHVFLGVIHVCMAGLVIVLQVIHISRHWKWITAKARKMIAL
jgi:hypothetical protein